MSKGKGYDLRKGKGWAWGYECLCCGNQYKKFGNLVNHLNRKLNRSFDRDSHRPRKDIYFKSVKIKSDYYGRVSRV